MPRERMKRSTGDTVHAVVKAAASAVPVAGGPLAELFAYLIEEPLSKRRDAWIEEIAGRVVDLEDRLAKPLADELKNNEAFTTVLLGAGQIAVRNHQREKIDALANAVLNTGLGLAPDETERAIMLSLVDRLTPLHIAVLSFFHGQRRVACGFLDTVYDAVPVLSGREELARRIWRDLVEEQLLRDGNFVVTDFGKQFLAFIAKPRTPSA